MNEADEGWRPSAAPPNELIPWDRARVLARLEASPDPRGQAQAIGETFIRVFEKVAREMEDTKFLVQGTLYPTSSRAGPRRARNQVAPQRRRPAEDMDFELIEPLRALFKDEVRAVGEELGIPRR